MRYSGGRCRDAGRRAENAAAGRRLFLRTLVLALGGAAALHPAGATAAARANSDGGITPPPIADLPWKRTIFCQFDWSGKHRQLLRALADCAREIDCELVMGDYDAPDIFACGCFVQVVDRSAIAAEVWRDYLEVYRNSGDVTPCFIIDDCGDLPLPRWAFAYQLDMNHPESLGIILETIREMKAGMDGRLPRFFRQRSGLGG